MGPISRVILLRSYSIFIFFLGAGVGLGHGRHRYKMPPTPPRLCNGVKEWPVHLHARLSTPFAWLLEVPAPSEVQHLCNPVRIRFCAGSRHTGTGKAGR